MIILKSQIIKFHRLKFDPNNKELKTVLIDLYIIFYYNYEPFKPNYNRLNLSMTFLSMTLIKY